jgi:hypothetical protein
MPIPNISDRPDEQRLGGRVHLHRHDPELRRVTADLVEDRLVGAIPVDRTGLERR